MRPLQPFPAEQQLRGDGPLFGHIEQCGDDPQKLALFTPAEFRYPLQNTLGSISAHDPQIRGQHRGPVRSRFVVERQYQSAVVWMNLGHEEFAAQRLRIGLQPQYLVHLCGPCDLAGPNVHFQAA